MYSNLKSQTMGHMLKKRYTLALSIIALLVIFSQMIIQISLISQQDDSRVVNIAGRQRMLSQRINKAAFGLYFTTKANDSQRYMEELNSSLMLWEKSHNGLQNGDLELGLPGKNSDEIIEIFADIEPQYQAILSAAKSIHKLAFIKGNNESELLEMIRIIQDNEQSFLKGMDTIVFQYDYESKQKVNSIRIIEIIILIVTFITLTIEVLFIFRPAQKQIVNSMDELEESKQNLEKLFETAPTAMFLIDEADFRVTKLNHMAKDILKVSLEDSLGIDLKNMLELNEGDFEVLNDKLHSGVAMENHEAVLRNKGNMSLVVLLSSNLIKYDDKSTILLGLSDITKLKEAEEVLKKYASVDEMTGFLNKRTGMLVLENVFNRERAETGELSICFIDIDGLKMVNDSYGHEEGDFYIKTVSQVIFYSTSSQDAKFRYGGDEFILILDKCERKGAEAVIARINNNLKSVSDKAAKPYPMHMSYGIAVLNEELVETFEELLSIADKRMYENKKINKDKLRASLLS